MSGDDCKAFSLKDQNAAHRGSFRCSVICGGLRRVRASVAKKITGFAPEVRGSRLSHAHEIRHCTGTGTVPTVTSRASLLYGTQADPTKR